MWRSSTKPFPVNQKSLLPCFALIILCQKANLVKPRSLLKETAKVGYGIMKLRSHFPGILQVNAGKM